MRRINQVVKEFCPMVDALAREARQHARYQRRDFSMTHVLDVIKMEQASVGRGHIFSKGMEGKDLAREVFRAACRMAWYDSLPADASVQIPA